ncbi:MAG TPA: hypothetical protein VJU61_09280 [Polyangiaceae bacterium]|nr:hypothetical protein [Polyangiaceae bacterium]
MLRKELVSFVGPAFTLRALAAGAFVLSAACAVDSRAVSSLTPGASGAGGPSSNGTSGAAGDPGGGSDGADPSESSDPSAPNELNESNESSAEPPAAALACAANGGACTAPLEYCLPRTGRCVSCAPGAQRCTAGVVELCNADGAWASQNTACGECIPDSAECMGSTLRVCSSAGRWVDRLQCAGSQPVCFAATARCVCDGSSCGAGQTCSATTRSCEVEASDCPALNATPANEDNDLGVVSVRFNLDGSANVTLQNIGGGIIFLPPQRSTLCNGADNCILLVEDATIMLNPFDSLERTLPATVPSGGEVAILSAFPPEAVGLGYVAWGSGPPQGSLEALANELFSYWQIGDRVFVQGGDTGFACTGRADLAASYVSCNP